MQMPSSDLLGPLPRAGQLRRWVAHEDVVMKMYRVHATSQAVFMIQIMDQARTGMQSLLAALKQVP